MEINFLGFQNLRFNFNDIGPIISIYDDSGISLRLFKEFNMILDQTIDFLQSSLFDDWQNKILCESGVQGNKENCLFTKIPKSSLVFSAQHLREKF